MIRDKEYQVLKFLGGQNKWSTAILIARALNCSVRSTKTYISNINSEYPALILSSREGYIVSDKKKLFDIINNEPDDIPQSAEGRKAYILKVLLLEQQTKNLDELADELCISPITLANEIAKIKSELGKFDLVFRTKNNNASIAGLEKNKKKMISHLIYEETKDYFSSLELAQTYIPDFDLKIIKHVVTDTLLSNHYFMDDFSLSNFVYHIGIMMERLNGNALNNESSELKNPVLIPAHVYALLTQICENLEKYFPIHFTDNEYYDLALVLMTRIIHENVNQLNPENLSGIVGEGIWDLVQLIQKKVRDTFYINLNSNDFIIRFSLHIRNMLIRLENQIAIRNPQFLSIKNSYPYIYEVSVFIANIITREKGLVSSEDEIAYIALHIGVLIEEQKAYRDKVKVLILCPKYYSSHVKLVKRIYNIFEDSILISGLITSLDELDNCGDHDLIISTIPLNRCPVKHFLQISNYLNNKDIGNIVNVIEEIKKARINTILENKLKFLFKKELFFYNPKFSDQHDAIDHMSDALLKSGHVDSTFREKLYERERMSSSAYTNIAMPHPLDMCSLSTAIAVSIHPNGINWNTTKVNIVFMLAINEGDRILFRDIFDFVTEIITNDKYNQTILNTKTYEEFINLLISFM